MEIIYSDKHRLHATDQIWIESLHIPCLEVPARAEVMRDALMSAGIGPLNSPSDFGLEPILDVHDPEYVAYLRTAFERNAAFIGRPEPLLVGSGVRPIRAESPPQDLPALQRYYTYDYEDPILPGTYEAAYWSAQCALTAAQRVRTGASACYALCRPPGHHAGVDQYGGFCYLNNAAIAARFLGAEGRVAILDIDYHHGNGTQGIFYSDPQVLFCSLHADPWYSYPFYWGYADELGAGPGLGYNRNWPLPWGTDETRYLSTLEQALDAIDSYAPRYLVVSLGLDIQAGDTIGQFAITARGLATIAARIAALRLPTVVVQEGGYALDRLGANLVAFLTGFERPCGLGSLPGFDRE